MTNTPTEVPWDEFMGRFDPAVHHALVKKARQDGVTHLVCFENLALECMGHPRSALPVGPACTLKTVEETHDKRLGEVPSQFQWPVAYTVARKDVPVPPPPPPPAPPPVARVLDAKKSVTTGDPVGASLVAAHLTSLGSGRCRSVVPVKVTFRMGVREWVHYGARFESVEHYQPQERMVTEMGKTPGAEYTEVRFDLLGHLAKPLVRHYYRLPDDDADWFRGSYYDKSETNEYHPFGPCFMLCRWDHERPWMGRIDQFDHKRRERVRTTVEVLG
jgi:hypothetical protein